METVVFVGEFSIYAKFSKLFYNKQIHMMFQNAKDFNRSTKLERITCTSKRPIMYIIQRIIKNVPRYEFNLIYCYACEFCT